MRRQARSTPPPRADRHRARITRLATPSRVRATRRVLLVVIVLELAVLAVWAMRRVGFSPWLAAGTVALLTADLLVSWFFIARNNRGRRRR